MAAAPILHVVDADLQPRPAEFAPSNVCIGRESVAADCWDGEGSR